MFGRKNGVHIKPGTKPHRGVFPWRRKGTFDSCVYTTFAHTIYDNLCIYNMCHFSSELLRLLGKNENILLAAEGAEDRVQVMHALDTWHSLARDKELFPGQLGKRGERRWC